MHINPDPDMCYSFASPEAAKAALRALPPDFTTQCYQIRGEGNIFVVLVTGLMDGSNDGPFLGYFSNYAPAP